LEERPEAEPQRPSGAGRTAARADDPVAAILASWGEMTRHRVRITDAVGHVFRLPVVGSQWEALAACMEPGVRVLDVGAGRRRFERRLREAFPGLVYESFDVDRALPHDYYDLDEARGPYDRVMVLDVLEHLSLEEGLGLLARARDLLAPGGRLVVMVPNTFSPSTCLWDATHRTHYSFAELGGALLALGFEFPEIVRVHKARLGQRVLRALLRPVLKLLQTDPATHVRLAARRPA
jgi:hypothetical protein